MKSALKSVCKQIAEIAFIISMLACVYVWYGFVASCIFNWFIADTTALSEITIAHGIGLVLLVNILTDTMLLEITQTGIDHNAVRKMKQLNDSVALAITSILKTDYEVGLREVKNSVIHPALILLAGYIAQHFIGG